LLCFLCLLNKAIQLHTSQNSEQVNLINQLGSTWKDTSWFILKVLPQLLLENEHNYNGARERRNPDWRHNHAPSESIAKSEINRSINHFEKVSGSWLSQDGVPYWPDQLPVNLNVLHIPTAVHIQWIPPDDGQ
jgi:hypothetical protein